MSDLHNKVGSLLIDLESELRNLNLWDAEMPAPEALLSTQPFCLDTLQFYQWLQFVFLPRMHQMVDELAPLPAQCGIGPMSEEFFRSESISGISVTELLIRLDSVLTSA